MGSEAAVVSSARLMSKLEVMETVQGAVGAAGEQVVSNALNQGQRSLTPSGTVPVSAYSAALYTLSGSGSGEAAIDLTDLAGSQANVDGTGKKVQALRLRAPADNAAAVTVAGGDASPYEPFGAGNSLDVPPGGEITCYFAEQLDDVSDTSGSAAKNLKLSGTADDTLYVEILLG